MMAERTPLVFKIDRRHLLAATAAATAAVAVPVAEFTDAVRAAAAQCPEIPVRNLCGANAKRLLEIAKRNEIRRKAGLPLLQVTRELRRMKLRDDADEFARFKTAHSNAVWEQVLAPRRNTEGNPHWRPIWSEA